jgi:hypothetical protein
MRACSGSGDKTIVADPITITNVQVKWDTLKIDSIVYVPKWKTKIETIYDTIPAVVDTLYILKDYYATHAYTDTLNLDSLGNIIINDIITKNSIVSRSIIPNILIPTTTITNTAYINRREFYGGFGIKGKSDQLNYLGGELLLRTKNQQAYSIGIGVNQEFQPVLGFGMYWKIGK